MSSAPKPVLQLVVDQLLTPADLAAIRAIVREELRAALDLRPERGCTVNEVMALIGVSRDTLSRWEREERLVPTRQGKKVWYSRRAVEAFIAGGSAASES